MNITKDTTDEQILVPLANARRRLAKTADPESLHSLDTIQQDLESVAQQFGAVRARSLYRDVLRGSDGVLIPEAAKEHANQILLGTLLESPNDTYSGRSNDTRRSEREGYRQAVARLVRGY